MKGPLYQLISCNFSQNSADKLFREGCQKLTQVFILAEPKKKGKEKEKEK